MCQRVFEEIDGRPGSLLTTVDLGRNGEDLILPDPFMRQIVSAVAETYIQLCESVEHWKFLRRKGKMLDVQPGVEEYDFPDTTAIDYASLYFKYPDGHRTPVYEGEYECYLADKQISDNFVGVPTAFIETPFPGKVVLSPKPNIAGEIWGEWWVSAAPLTNPTDEPPWTPALHQIIPWLVIKELALTDQDLTGDELNSAAQSRRMLYARARRQVRTLLSSLRNQYLPDFYRG